MADPPPVDDDLEYHVTFPAPLPDTDKFVAELNGSKKEPVVVLIGWSGSGDKDLAKFSLIYEQHRFITVRVPMAAEEAEDPVIRAALATKILELLLDLDLEENNIVFHAFGNYSCTVLLLAMQELHGGRRFSELKVAGVVFDSAPARSAPRATPVVATSLFGAAWRSILGAAQWLVGTVAYYSLGLRSTPSVYEQLRDGPWQWPELYLYSEADKSTPYSDVDEVVLHRKRMKVCVEALRWDDTDHLSHIDSHRSAYEELCVRFVRQHCSGTTDDDGSCGDCSD